MAAGTLTASSAQLTITPAGGSQSTIVYTSLVARVCLKGSATTCKDASCTPAAAGQACTVVLSTEDFPQLTSGSTYTATAVATAGAAGSTYTSASSPAIEFAMPYP